MRFVAPARAAIDPAVFERPPLSLWRQFGALLHAREWPAVETLNSMAPPAFSTGGSGGSGVATKRLDARTPACGSCSDSKDLHRRDPDSWSVPPRFVEQTPKLVADGLHYELRIAQRGEIATRPGSWHDLLNALVWLRYPQIKAALNARQVAEIAIAGPKLRTRAQCALTHFDEAGVIVALRDPKMLALWDAHDWQGLFRRERTAWTDGRIAVQVFGHALLEHALRPRQLVVGKALAVLHRGQVEKTAESGDASAAVAAAIATGAVLLDPQELRPLPLSGIPGWHADNDSDEFYRAEPCFRPLRSGRTYPVPLALDCG